MDLLRRFARWQSERLGRDDTSTQAYWTVQLAAAIANVVKLDQGLPPNESRRPVLAEYASGLKYPAPLHDKHRYHWATLPEIEAVANSLIVEGRRPFFTRRTHGYSGALRGVLFQRGLIMKLLVRVPLRQRNIRELRYPKNLWKHPTSGEWILRFEGKELKVGERKGRTNVFEVRLSQLYPKDGPTPDDFIPTLEEFITDYRPLLPNAKTSPYLFLTYRGNPFTAKALGTEISTAMERRTGIKLNPHLIRDIAATTLLKQGTLL